VRNILSGGRYKVVVAAGVLVLIVLIAADIWLWQTGDDPDRSQEINQGASGATAVPGLPSPPSSDGSNPTSGATLTDSTTLEINRSGSGPGVIVGDNSTLSDSVVIETTGEVTGTGTGVTTGDGTSVTDSAVVEVQEAPSPPPSGGPVNNTQLQDSAGIVVRDAQGNIKQQETVK